MTPNQSLTAGFLWYGIFFGISAVPCEAGSLTFNKDVAPIIFNKCATCHRPGESAPFDLLSYEDVRKHAKQIALVTESRYMPPWLPDPGFGKFLYDRSLSDEEIQTIKEWVEEGSLEGVPSDLPPLPEWTQGWHLGTPDLVVEMTEPYTLPAEGPDEYRNFVIPVPVETTRYVRAFELRPGNKKAVHHATIGVDRSEKCRLMDEEDPGPGFDGMGKSPAASPDGHFLGWTPGKVPSMGEEDMAWQLEKGSDLVLELHMPTTGKPETVQAKIGLYFADKPPTRLPLVIGLSNKKIDIPAGEKSYLLKDHYVIPVDVEAHVVYPHAHYLGKDMKGYVILPDGEKRWLIRISDWDFNWQDEYRYSEPIHLPQGSILSLEYTYDNSAENGRNPHIPPRRVVFGPNTTDEMCDLVLQVFPMDSRDRETLANDFNQKVLYSDLAVCEFFLEKDPTDTYTLEVMANTYFQLGRPDEAIAAYEQALQIDPNLSTARSELAVLLIPKGKYEEAFNHIREAQRVKPFNAREYMYIGDALINFGGKFDEGIEYYQNALKIRPDFDQIQHKLAAVLQYQGRTREAAHIYEEMLKSNPDDENLSRRMVRIYFDTGETDKAIELLRKFLESHPGDIHTLEQMGSALMMNGKPDEGIRCFEEMVESNPDSAEAHYKLGCAYEHIKKIEKAITQFKNTLEIDPNSESARKNLDSLLDK